MLPTRAWIQVASIVFAASLLSSATASQSGTPTSVAADNDPVNREIILVFDPRGSPPAASEIVHVAPSDSRAPAYKGLFGSTESLRQWFPFQLLPPDQADSLRARNPIAPQLLFHEVIIVRYPPGTDMNAQLQRIKSDGRVLAAIRNFKMQFSVTPNDPFFAVNAGTPTTGIQGKYQWGWSLLRFPQAWDKLRGTAYVADINNGIYWQNGATLPDLQANLRPHFSTRLGKTVGGTTKLFYFDPNIDEPGPMYKGHGTHVAGLIAATPNNGIGVVGGCWNCSFIELGIDLSIGADAVAAALTEAIRRGAQVVNMSLGVAPQNSPDQYLPSTFCANNAAVPPCNVIITAQDREIVLVAASGNDTYQVQFPANQPGVMAIGGLQFVDQSPTARFWVDGYLGPTGVCPLGTDPNLLMQHDTGSNCGSTQFLVAPAKDVLSTFYPGFSWNPDLHCADRADPARQGIDSGWTGYVTTGYGDCTGTSMAAPHVSALAGLMRSANPLLKVADIRRLMQRHASGNDVRLGDQMGYGYPIADNAVISVLSGASAANPTLFDTTVKNKLTPLFSLYSSQGRNHFYSIAPQMAVAAVNGTLIPSPKLKVNATSYAASCTPPNSCSSVALTTSPSSVTPSIVVLKPDGSIAGGIANYAVEVDWSSGTSTNPLKSIGTADSNGVVNPNMKWPDPPQLPYYSATIKATPIDSYLLIYSIVGNLVPGYNLFPTLTNFGQNPRSSTSVYASHVNPLGSGPDLIPLYRLSWRCGDSPKPVCDGAGLPNYNPFHISHAYTTDAAEKQSLISAGYKLDGIEGYVFPTNYSSAPQAGMVKLCRLYDPNSDEEILFPGMGANGKNCYPPFPSYAGSSYYSSSLYSTNWLGWVYPNYNGGTPPTSSITSPANGATFNLGTTVTLKANATGSVSSVSYYANGVLIGTKTTSPYQKNWNPQAAGTYTLYAVALQGSTGLTTTSAPITITVGAAPPTLGNNGFESPVVGSGPSAYVFGPTGASWTFDPISPTGGSGVSGNGSNFTLGNPVSNPDAPFGVQVGFIQGAKTISQTVNFAASGSYHVTFYAAQRAANQNGFAMTINVLVDGTNYGQITPSGTSYQLYSSNPIPLNPGNHTITFQGLNPNGYDITVFFDNVLITSP